MNIPIRTLLFTVAALLSFAANSVLCRLALRGDTIDPATFTGVRLAAGAVLLALAVGFRRVRRTKVPPVAASSAQDVARAATFSSRRMVSAFLLATYAIGFSFAYVSLEIGTGALLLFGSVQATIVGWGLIRGDRPSPVQWIGLAAALSGLAYLVLPGLEAPDPVGAALMSGAGIAWGLYTVRGKSESDPAVSTAGNFVASVPFGLMAMILAPALPSGIHAEPAGFAYAAISGGVTSGLGYVAWYAALPRLSAPAAAVVQLAVPILAGAAGALLAQEAVSQRLAAAAILTVGGIAVVVFSAKAQVRSPSDRGD